MRTRGPGDAELSGRLLSPSRLGDLNRSRVMQALVDNGPLSRADLAKMADVTRATIGGIVQSLMDAGVIEEGPPQVDAHAVGKPARPLWFTARAGLTAAAALGPGRYEVALVNARGDILEHRSGTFAARSATAAVLGERLVAELSAVLPRSRKEVLGVGVAVPGICDTASGAVIASGQLPALQGKGIARAIDNAFGLDVCVDNDSRAQALGEKWFGKGRGRSRFASVQTGEGLGVGLVLDGAIYRASGAAGELGHTCVVLEGGEPCRCGLRGCWETVATLRWLRAEANRRGIAGARSLDSRKLVARVSKGDKQAGALLDTYADHLGAGLANLAQLLDPGLFILHGDAVGGGDELRRRIEARMRARTFELLAPSQHVELSDLDQRAGLLGAAALVLSETFNLVA